ncbi:PIR Superfamily Protein, partial [Plasmodium ovale curtisi]
YGTFEEYEYNEDILDRFNKGIVSEDFDKFSSSSVNEYVENRQKVIEDCITLKDDNELNEKNICSTKINNMNTDKFEKMNKLYNIYKYYRLQKSNINLACIRANSCATEYNNILSKYTQIEDTKFCKVLEDLKKKFDMDVLQFKNQCSSEISDLFSYQEASRHGEIEVAYSETSCTQPQQILSSTEVNNTSPSSLGATLPITLFSLEIGALLIFLSFYKKFKGISKKTDEEEYKMHQNIS